MTWIARRVTGLLIVVEIVWHRAIGSDTRAALGIADAPAGRPDEAARRAC